MRIVSLIPCATEMLWALGGGPLQVGRSHECDYPAEVLALPACTRPSFPDGKSKEIDRDLRALVEQGLSVYRVDAEALKALKPDLILTQDHCQVCAVSLSDVENALCGWLENSACRVLSLRPQGLEDVLGDVFRVAKAAGLASAPLLAAMRGRLERIKSRAPYRQKRVVCVEWIEPLMAAGYWTPELVLIAGGHDVLGVEGGHAPWITAEQILYAQPDAVVVMPCGFDLERCQAEMSAWPENLKHLPVYLTDGNAYFNRSGPRLVESAEILAEILHPDHFDFGWKGRAWVNYSP